MGDSFVNGERPDANPDLAGGSYLSLGDALISRRQRVVNAGQAGAFSFDVQIPEGSWKGYNSQLEELFGRSVWFDGVNRLDTIVISTMNDCLVSFTEYPFSQAALNTYITNTQQAAQLALTKARNVIVVKPIQGINMELAAPIYGIPYYISEADYLILTHAHEEAFSNMAGIKYADIYEKASTIDGLHPDEWSQDKAAKEIIKLL